MGYLYGDSTPSPLEVNFFDFLRDSVDFCVQVLLSSERLRREIANGEALRRAASTDAARFERLGSAVSLALKDAYTGEGNAHVAPCAVAIIRATGDLVRTEIEQLNATCQSELAKLEAVVAREREASVQALEALLLRHDLPDTKTSLSVQAQGSGLYAARLRASTPYGVDATIELDVPSSHLYGNVIRVARIVERLEVQLPSVDGWLHKESKMRAQRLEKLHVVDLTLNAAESLIKLRVAADGSGSGFDIRVRAEAPRVQLMRVGEREGGTDPAFDVGGADMNALLTLHEKLEAAAKGLMDHRKSLVQVTLDNRPLRDHENPTVLVERLVSAMSPVVQEIARRSPSATELVLKRVVSDGRREEVFVTKAELKKKLEPLPSTLRTIFDPLGLAAGSAGPPALPTPAARAAPSGSPRSSPPPGIEAATLRQARHTPVPEARAEEPRPGDETSGMPAVAPARQALPESSRSPAPKGTEPATMIQARRAPTTETRPWGTPRPASTPPKSAEQSARSDEQAKAAAKQAAVEPGVPPAAEAPRRT